jgi:hypothetical protein
MDRLFVSPTLTQDNVNTEIMQTFIRASSGIRTLDFGIREVKTVYTLNRTPIETDSIKTRGLLTAEFSVVLLDLVDGHSTDTFAEMQDK